MPPKTLFMPGSTGAFEAQLWEFTAPPGEEEESEQPVPRRIAAPSLEEAIGYLRREHGDFIIIKAELVDVIVLLSGSPLD